MTTPLPSYVDVWRLINSICIILRKSVSNVASACSVIMLWNSLPMQPPTILQLLIYVYVSIQRNFYREILCSRYWVLFLYFFCRTRKEARMEARMEACMETRFPPIMSQIHDTTWVTRKDMRSLVWDSNKIGKLMRVIKNEGWSVPYIAIYSLSS